MADSTTLLDELRVMFPWLDQIGVDPAWFQDVAAETFGSPEAVLVRFRQLPQYKARFPGLWRQDGTVRMNESQYLQTEEAYRSLFRQYGIDEASYRTPSDLATLFDSEVDPNELRDRLRVYAGVRDGSQSVRDAFYVYAGMDLSVDDLFEAVVDPTVGSRLSNQYVEAVSGQSFDYQTFIDRVATVAGRRAAELVSMSGNTVTIKQVQQNPELTKTVLDLLYTSAGDDLQGQNRLSLEELLASFEEAVLGSAALDAGLAIPDRERVAELRAAGVDRAKAQSAYLEFARLGGSLSGGAQRAGVGSVSQDSFERGVMLGQGAEMRRLQTAAQYEEAAGRAPGSFQFDRSQSGEFVQRGLV
jgi:hypothetical protein